MTKWVEFIRGYVNQIRESIFFEFLKTPFFNLGEFELSLWLVLKMLVFIWSFIALAGLVNRFLDKRVYPKLNLDETTAFTISAVMKYFFVIVGFFTGFSLLGIKPTLLTVFAGTIGIGIGLGLQDIAKNFISGIIILAERPVKVGDYVQIGDLPGRVKNIKARCTIVDTFDNTSVVIPNSEIVSQQITNWSYSDRIVRVTAEVGVAYGSDTDKVKNVLLEVPKELEVILKKPAPYVQFDGFGDSSLNFKLFVWINRPQDRLQIKSDLNFIIDRKFRENQITIPFPQRDLHIKSSNVSF